MTDSSPATGSSAVKVNTSDWLAACCLLAYSLDKTSGAFCVFIFFFLIPAEANFAFSFSLRFCILCTFMTARILRMWLWIFIAFCVHWSLSLRRRREWALFKLIFLLTWACIAVAASTLLRPFWRLRSLVYLEFAWNWRTVLWMVTAALFSFSFSLWALSTWTFDWACFFRIWCWAMIILRLRFCAWWIAWNLRTILWMVTAAASSFSLCLCSWSCFALTWACLFLTWAWATTISLRRFWACCIAWNRRTALWMVKAAASAFSLHLCTRSCCALTWACLFLTWAWEMIIPLWRFCDSWIARNLLTTLWIFVEDFSCACLCSFAACKISCALLYLTWFWIRISEDKRRLAFSCAWAFRTIDWIQIAAFWPFFFLFSALQTRTFGCHFTLLLLFTLSPWCLSRIFLSVGISRLFSSVWTCLMFFLISAIIKCSGWCLWPSIFGKTVQWSARIHSTWPQLFPDVAEVSIFTESKFFRLCWETRICGRKGWDSVLFPKCSSTSDNKALRVAPTETSSSWGRSSIEEYLRQGGDFFCTSDDEWRLRGDGLVGVFMVGLWPGV